MHSKNNDRRLRKFLIDMFNLIFGKGHESDYFWQHVLFKQCEAKFDIETAIAYHESTTQELGEILSRERVNHQALYFNLMS